VLEDETWRNSSLIQHCIARSCPLISEAGTIQGPIGQNVSQLLPKNHCTPIGSMQDFSSAPELDSDILTTLANTETSGHFQFAVRGFSWCGCALTPLPTII